MAAVAICALPVLTLPTLGGRGQAPTAVHLVGPSGGSYSGALASATAQVTRAVNQSLLQTYVPANLTPSLLRAGQDLPSVFFDGCQVLFTSSALAPCQFGSTSSHSSIVLFGDSHASMWFPAVNDASKQLGLKLVTWTKDACPPLLAPSYSPVLNRTFTECGQWRQNVLAGIAKLHPTLVILSMTRNYSAEYGEAAYDAQWLKGLSAMVRRINRLGPRVVVIGPIPKPPSNVPDCLSVHLTTSTFCAVAIGPALDLRGEAKEASVVRAAGGTYFDPKALFCYAGRCATIVDNLLVYRDDNHITTSYSSFLAPVITDELGVVLGGRLDPARVGPTGPSRS